MIIPQNRLYSGARLSFTKSLFHTLLSILILTSTFSSTSISASTSPSPSISASASPSSSVPTNILLFIGDGMGFEQVAAAGMVAHGAAGTLSFEAMPFQGAVTTRSSNNLVTDSAAAATSLATGFKVNNGVLSQAIPGDNRELQTLLEHLKMQGKSTGLVTTTNLTHATPAAFGAHESSRGNTTQIAADYLGQTRPLVLMGGGGYGLSASAADAAGYTVVTNTVGLQALDTEAAGLVAGLFGTGNLPYEFDGLGSLPHLSQMTEAALAILDNDPDGFFLMVEGGRIDHAGHANDLQRNISETLEFAHSVQVGLDWASGRDDTLIVVTADHETGGLSVLANNGQGNLPTVTWSTGGHTGQQVPVYAWGVNADRFAGTLDNTQFRNRMLGLSDFGDCAVDRHIDAGDFSALVLEVFDGDGSDPESVAGGSFPGDPEGCNPNRDLAIDAGDMSCLVRTVFEGPGLCENSLAAGPAVAGQETGLNWGNWVTGLNGVEHSVVDSSGGAGLLTGTDADPVGAGLLTGPDVRDDGAGFLSGTARAQLSVPTQSPLAPALSIPLQIPANAGDTVAVPITFMPDSSGISTLFFSVDYDQTWLSFDPTDADLDGIPDNISFSIPPAFFPGVTFDPGDIDGELDIAIADFLPPLGSLPGGVVATITFGVGFPVWPTEARVSFSSDPHLPSALLVANRSPA